MALASPPDPYLRPTTTADRILHFGARGRLGEAKINGTYPHHRRGCITPTRSAQVEENVGETGERVLDDDGEAVESQTRPMELRATRMQYVRCQVDVTTHNGAGEL